MKTPFLTLALLATLSLAAHATPNDGITGPYARVEVGRSSLGLPGAQAHGQSFKVFGGYRFDENLGLEAGYAALGSFSQNVAVGGASVTQDGKARSLFAAATGRLPLGESFALHGRLGVSAGRVSGTNLLPADDALIGRQTSVLFGAGAEFRPRPNVALTVNADSYGKVSKNVKARAVVFGLHFTL